MDELRREHFHQFADDILDEAEQCRTCRAHVRTDHGLSVSVNASQFRTVRHHFLAVSRNFELRNHIYVTLSSICHDFAHIILCKITTLGKRAALFCIMATEIPPLLPSTTDTPRSLLSKFRMRINLDSPAGIIGKMQMQFVQLKQGHRIQLLNYKVLVSEISGYVEHHSAIPQTWPVQNIAA